VNLKAFFVATLSSALDLGIANADDVLRHVTPDVLAAHLPRPLWARLLTACLGAPRVDAQLVVETVGVPNLCEHVPAQIIWGCIQEVGQRALSGVVIATPAAPISRPNAAGSSPVSRPIPLATPPPPATESRVAATPLPASVGPSIPAPGMAASEADVDGPRTRLPPGQRFRQSSSGIGRLAATSAGARRPQAQAAPPVAPPSAAEPERSAQLPRVKRGQTEADFDVETSVGGKDDWRNAIAVEDEQLVDWSASDEAVGGADELGRKR
jgi:hypothetical protein